MKKVIVGVFLCFIGLTQVNAQVTFKPGIIAGINFSHFTKGDEFTRDYYYYSYDPVIDPSSKSEFSSTSNIFIGGYGELKLTKVYSLQPEVIYTTQGTNVTTTFSNNQVKEETIKLSYISLGLINKFNFNEKFNVHIGPTLDFQASPNKNFSPSNNFDLAFQLGLGYNFTKEIGVIARIKKGVIPMIDNPTTRTNVVFSVGGTYTFDLK